MNETVRWLIAIVIAFAGIGLGMFFQGKALMNPEKHKAIGKQVYKTGIVWIAIAIIYLIVVILLQLFFQGE